jgi:hypothetical protein
MPEGTEAGMETCSMCAKQYGSLPTGKAQLRSLASQPLSLRRLKSKNERTKGSTMSVLSCSSKPTVIITPCVYIHTSVLLGEGEKKVMVWDTVNVR